MTKKITKAQARASWIENRSYYFNNSTCYGNRDHNSIRIWNKKLENIASFEEKYYAMCLASLKFNKEKWHPLFDDMRKYGEFYGEYSGKKGNKSEKVVMNCSGDGCSWNWLSMRGDLWTIEAMLSSNEDLILMLNDPRTSRDCLNYIEKRMKGLKKQVLKNQSLINQWFKIEHQSMRIYRVLGYYRVIFDEWVNETYKKEGVKILQLNINGRRYQYLWDEQSPKDHYGIWKRILSPGEEIKTYNFNGLSL